MNKRIKHSENLINRNYISDHYKLRNKLGKKYNKKKKRKTNKEESKYFNYSFNGSFHKGLPHDQVTGSLLSNKNYVKYVRSLLKNDQKNLADLPLSNNSQIKLSNPLGSLSSVVVGSPQLNISVKHFPILSSKTSACEMIELYCMALSRDVPFNNYDCDEKINKILDYMNDRVVLSKLKKYSHFGLITTKSIFRGISDNQLSGPYLSQFLYLNVPIGATTIVQKYNVYPTKEFSLLNNINVEWGISSNQIISIQETNLNNLPPIPIEHLQKRYIYSGRALTEIVHNDPPYQFYYQASLILTTLGCQTNPGFPSFKNQTNLITNSGTSQLLTSLGEVTNLALKHVWYWKWQVYRRMRPEVYSLWIDNIKNNKVSNDKNYDISDVILKNNILEEIKSYNLDWGVENSFTLPLTYREGSPTHPSYPAAHATIAGACCTLLKIFFDTEKKWNSLPELGKYELSQIKSLVVQSNEDGTELIPYNDFDIEEMTIAGEINKLGFNIGFGRNWAGVHYRSDIIEGLKLGEQIAIDYMKDILSMSVENNLNNTPPSITFRKFDNSLVTIEPSLL